MLVQDENFKTLRRAMKKIARNNPKNCNFFLNKNI